MHPLNLILGIVSRPRLTLIIAGLAVAVCVVLALTRLPVSSDEEELTASDKPYSKDFRAYEAKFPETDTVCLIVEVPPSAPQPPLARWTAVAEALAAKMRSLSNVVESVEYKVPLEQLGQQALLFAPRQTVVDSLADMRRFALLMKAAFEEPTLLTKAMGATPLERLLTVIGVQKLDKQSSAFLNLLAQGWVRTLQRPAATTQPLRTGVELPDFIAFNATDPSDLGYDYLLDESDPSRQRHLLLVQAYPKVNYTSLTAISNVVDTIRHATAQVARDYPDFTIRVGGRPAIDADEMQISDRDSDRAEVLALSVIFVGMAIMLRSLWLALAAEISLATAIGWTFGWASVTVGELNLISLVFLIALIGIGMDYLVQVLMAYRREARRRLRPKAIWVRVFRSVGPPINTACMGAACAFGVSWFTDFRGAAQLGIIAGGGLLLCLLSGYTVLPALLVLFPPKFKQIESAQRYSGRRARGHWWRLIQPAIWVLLLALGVRYMLRAHFNANLLDMQAPNLESVQLIRKLQTWRAVVLSRDLDMLRKVRQSLAGSPYVQGTESILDAYDNYQWLSEQDEHGQTPHFQPWNAPPIEPSQLPVIATKAAALAQSSLHAQREEEPHAEREGYFAAFVQVLQNASAEQQQRYAVELSAWQNAFAGEVAQQLRQFTPAPPDVSALPAQLRDHLVSRDGEYALYIIPAGDCWQQEVLGQFIGDIESRIYRVQGHPHITGTAFNVFYSTKAVEQSFYWATAYAILAIFILVLLDLRNLRQTLMAVSVLALGLPMLLALMGLLGISWNFANFFGLPILIGAGHEYGVFMVHRYREALRNPRRAWRRWDTADRALLLCAFVTSSSFGFFYLLGHHRGLMSLGEVMALGSGCIYLASLLVLRPFLLWRIERKNKVVGTSTTTG